MLPRELRSNQIGIRGAPFKNAFRSLKHELIKRTLNLIVTDLFTILSFLMNLILLKDLPVIKWVFISVKYFIGVLLVLNDVF